MNYILVDLDDTIARKVSRHKYQWEKVGEDAPIRETIDLVVNYPARIIILTARNEGYKPTEKLKRKFSDLTDDEIRGIGRKATEEWLAKHIGLDKIERVIMKPAESMESSDTFKMREIENLIEEGFDIDFLIDDNDHVIEMVRESQLINVLHFKYA